MASATKVARYIKATDPKMFLQIKDMGFRSMRAIGDYALAQTPSLATTADEQTVVVKRKSKATGATITIGCSTDLGLPDNDGNTLWWCVCEHGSEAGFKTRTGAVRAARNPIDWCKTCK